MAACTDEGRRRSVNHKPATNSQSARTSGQTERRPSAIRALIIRLFLVEYTVQGVWKLLRRHGWSPQMPARRALERDDASVERWRSEVWGTVKPPRRPGRLHLLRGRSRAGTEAAEGAHVGTARPDTAGAGAWREPGTVLRDGTGLPQER
ncbi:winged helix-turn-helix domain-containing protein [Streptomyces sp. AC555_RSS877]|uniref:helix-turn-helix domain-containing protein n=1 Tax=Streptomyces sp. AC555_RSS877 TaxID=2823688 RepID=UPI0020B7A3DE|nr:winged helix-turn-helix domain-containing protein [Streptomyces sp. AC555_RSS877]